jgi:hypothetical protein
LTILLDDNYASYFAPKKEVKALNMPLPQMEERGPNGEVPYYIIEEYWTAPDGQEYKSIIFFPEEGMGNAISEGTETP